MKWILKILFALMLLVIVVVLSGLFLPKELKIVQTIEIPVSREIVYQQISDFKNWKNWSPWAHQDSTMQISYGEKTSGQQAEMNWESKIFGSCELTITHAVPPESNVIDFNFDTDSKNTTLWYIEPTPKGSRLNWTMNLRNLGTIERYFAFFQKKKMYSLVQLGLEKLSKSCVELKYSRTGNINIVEMPSIPAVVIMDSVKPGEVEAKMKINDAYLKRFFERRELQPAGKAFKMVYGIVNDTLEKYAYGYPLEERTWVWRTLKYLQIPEGRVITISHYGSQSNTSNAHIEVEKFIKANNMELNGFPWEVYLFNPETDLDTSLWETQVYFPIK